MSRGLNQFEIGSVADPNKVTGTVSTPPGNDQKLNRKLADLQLRNRAQPLSCNTQTSIVVDVVSDASATKKQHVVFRPLVDSILLSAEIHVREVEATTGFPEVTVDGYLLGLKNYVIGGSNNGLDPKPGYKTVTVVPSVNFQAIALNSSKGGPDPRYGFMPLPIINDFFSADSFFVLRITPPAYNGSSIEGWKLATVTLHFAEFHQA